MSNTMLDKGLTPFRLKKREDFCFHKVKTLQPYGFNPLSANHPRWSNIFEQFVGCCRRIA